MNRCNPLVDTFVLYGQSIIGGSQQRDRAARERMNPRAGSENSREIQRVGGRDHFIARRRGTADRPQQIHGLGCGELLADESGNEASAPYFTARFEAPQRHQQVAPSRTERFARRDIAKYYAPSQQQLPRERLGILGAGGRFMIHESPAPS